MIKMLVALSVSCLFACNSKQTNDVKQEALNASSLNTEQKDGLRIFLTTKLAEVEADIKKYPDSSLLLSTKEFITQQINKYK